MSPTTYLIPGSAPVLYSWYRQADGWCTQGGGGVGSLAGCVRGPGHVRVPAPGPGPSVNPGPGTSVNPGPGISVSWTWNLSILEPWLQPHISY